MPIFDNPRLIPRAKPRWLSARSTAAFPSPTGSIRLNSTFESCFVVT